MKTWFLSRAPREKILVLVLVAAGALIWVSAASGHVSAAFRSWKSAGNDLASQQVWLDNRATIESAAAVAVGNLDAGKTYDATTLVAEVMALAARSNLQINSDPPRTMQTTQFAFHTVQLSGRRASLPNVIAFYSALAERAPYLALEQLVLQSDRGAPGQLNVSMQVASVELLKAK